MKIEFRRHVSDWSWDEDGSDIRDFGWSLMLYVRGKHRVRWNSTRATTPMWPHFIRGTDENCNRAITFTCWPIGMLDIWWEPNWRPIDSGVCDKCLAEFEDELNVA